MVLPFIGLVIAQGQQDVVKDVHAALESLGYAVTFSSNLFTASRGAETHVIRLDALSTSLPTYLTFDELLIPGERVPDLKHYVARFEFSPVRFGVRLDGVVRAYRSFALGLGLTPKRLEWEIKQTLDALNRATDSPPISWKVVPGWQFGRGFKPDLSQRIDYLSMQDAFVLAWALDWELTGGGGSGAAWSTPIDVDGVPVRIRERFLGNMLTTLPGFGLEYSMPKGDKAPSDLVEFNASLDVTGFMSLQATVEPETIRLRAEVSLEKGLALAEVKNLVRRFAAIAERLQGL